MKINIIKQQLISRFESIGQGLNKPSEKNVIRTWGLTYKQNRVSGFVDQLGEIDRNNSSIKIINGEIIPVKKPFYMTWKGVLKRINEMLGNTIENMDNPEVVKTRFVNIHCFSEEQVNRLRKLE